MRTDNATTTDVLGTPYTATTFTFAPDREGEVVATLVHRPAPTPTSRAVLYIHGFCDYFFQTELAEFYNARGYDFYALDLRKYGRSLRPGQTPCDIDDLRTYYDELDAAWSTIAESHDTIVVSGHSTGGLTTSLWLADRQHPAAALVLNAPWLDMAGDAFTRHILMPVLRVIGAFAPRRPVPRKVGGFYGKSLHRTYEGEWEYNLAWKPITSFPVTAGWARAILTGHARVRRGLRLPMPVLVLASAASSHPTSDNDPRIHSTDIVLDVNQIRDRARGLGRDVTVVSVEGALHDVVLSAPPVRAQAYTALGDFLGSLTS